MDTSTLAHPPTPDTRESRALEFYRAQRRGIVLIDRDTYECPSQDGTRTYTVTYGHDAAEGCTCPDAMYRGAACVHLYAVALCRAKRRGDTARRLEALEDRYEHDLDEDARLEVLDEIRALRRKLGR